MKKHAFTALLLAAALVAVPFTVSADNSSNVTTITPDSPSQTAVMSVTYVAEAIDLSPAKITLDAENFEYTGGKIQPKIKSVTLDIDGTPTTLKEGVDFTVEYVDNVDISGENTPARVVITGIGWYTGTAEHTFEIVPPAETTTTPITTESPTNTTTTESETTPAPTDTAPEPTETTPAPTTELTTTEATTTEPTTTTTETTTTPEETTTEATTTTTDPSLLEDATVIEQGEEITLPTQQEIPEDARIVIADERIVRILPDGRIVGVTPGTTTITIYYPDGTIEIITVTVTEVIDDYEYKVTSKEKFYFSHDEREFQPEDLVAELYRRPVYSSGTIGDWELTDISAITIPGTPKSAWTTPYYRGDLPATVTQQLVKGDTVTKEIRVGEVTIAVLGDDDLNGEVNAVDASNLLEYCAAIGAGETDVKLFAGEDPWEEALALNLAETDRNAELNAVDASNMLMFAAIAGAEGEGDWLPVLGTLPLE